MKIKGGTQSKLFLVVKTRLDYIYENFYARSPICLMPGLNVITVFFPLLTLGRVEILLML